MEKRGFELGLEGRAADSNRWRMGCIQGVHLPLSSRETGHV